MKRHIWCLVVVCCAVLHSDGQSRSIDSFLNTLDNARLNFLVLHLLHPPAPAVEQGPRNRVSVYSFNVDSAVAIFNKDTLVRRLLGLLYNDGKDWYANVLLYQLTGRDALKLEGMKRNAWEKEYKKTDLDYWEAYRRRLN